MTIPGGISLLISMYHQENQSMQGSNTGWIPEKKFILEAGADKSMNAALSKENGEQVLWNWEHLIP